MVQAHLRLCFALASSALLSLHSVQAVQGCGGGDRNDGFAVPDASAPTDVDASDGASPPLRGDAAMLFSMEASSIALGDASPQAVPVASVYFMPSTLDVTAPSTASFTLMAKPVGGGADFAVTPTMAVFNRPDLASMTVADPVVLDALGQAAGTGTLQAVYGGKVAAATLVVTVHLTSTGTGVDPSAPGALDMATSPDPSVTSLLYPYDKTVFPLGITSPLAMWNAPKAGDVYRLRYTEKGFTCDDYEVIAAPAQQRMPQQCWDWMTSSNQGDAVQVTLSRWDAASKTAYVSATESWPLALANMQGAVYYWSIGNDTTDGYLALIQPGTQSMPQIITGAASGAPICIGCHAVSSDGTTLVGAVGVGSPAPPPAQYPTETTSGSPAGPCANDFTCDEDTLTDGRAWSPFDLSATAPFATLRYQSNMFGGSVAVNHDGSYTVFGDVQLFLANTKTGQLYSGTGLDNVALDPGNVGLMMPAFSPDGAHLVAVEGPPDPKGGESYISLAGPTAELLQLDFNESTQAFSNPKKLVPESTLPAGQSSIAYPTYSPDSNWLAFHVGDAPTGCDGACTLKDTSLGAIYLANTSGATPAMRLTTLTDFSVSAAQANHTLEPTFNPVARGGYFWAVVSSERDWGNRITVGGGTPRSATPPTNGDKRLWVAAIDATPGSGDPSHPPFFLEGQEETRMNSRGFWALAACLPTQGGGACTAGFQCCSGYCDKGTCVDMGGGLGPTCTPLGGACTMTSQCCNNPVVTCQDGVCGMPVQ